MDVVLHSIFIWPVQSLVEFLYLLMTQLSGHHPGVALVLLSLAVNLLVLPLYLVADRWQKEEKELLVSMRPKLADIRAVFRGDERHMIQQTYYRQRGYHPLLSLRSSVGLLMQIPFFLAAYMVLSHATGLKGSTAWVIQDLALPDGLFHVGDFSINVLPLLMTAINFASALVYAKNMRLRDNVQLVVLASVFLVLLYNSPSGLVLYWTVNNLFSLGKNIVCRFRKPGRILHGALIAAILFWTLWYALVAKHLTVVTALAALVVTGVVAVLPKLWSGLVRALEVPAPDRFPAERRMFRFSCLFLFLLSGVAVPILFVASSPGDVPQGWWAIGRTTLQMGSLFLFLPFGLWALASTAVRRLMGWGMAVLAVSAVFFAFVFPPTVTFNASFTVGDPHGLEGLPWWIESVAVGLGAVALVVLVVRMNRVPWAVLVLGMGSASLGLVSAVMAFSVPPPPAPSAPVKNATEVTPVFHLTKTGHNQFLVFIDGSPAASFPEMLASVPGFKDSLEGFTWYANSLSYTPMTFMTTPAMMGGPEYTPDAINSRTGVPLKRKHDDGLRVMPKLMGAAGERVVLTDPWYISADGNRSNEVFKDLPGTRALNLHGLYSDLYFKTQHLQEELPPLLAFDNDSLARFSLFRICPPGVRPGIYDDGQWWKVAMGNHVSGYITGGLPNLVLLPKLCQVDDGPDSGSFFFSEVYHDTGAFSPGGLLQSEPVEVPARDIDKFGDFYSARNIYDGRVVMNLVKQWIQWLKDQGVYDRTRIMIVADHGHPLAESRFGPKPWFRPLILFKDYDRRGPLVISEELKTNADVPSLLTAGMPHAVPPRDANAPILVHNGPTWLADQKPDAYVFTQTMRLIHPDSRVPENWVEVQP